MRKLFIPAAVVATLCATTDASSFEHRVNLSATVPLICSFGTPTPLGTFIGPVSSASSDLAVDVTGGHVGDQTAKLTFTDVACNGESTHVALARSGLRGGLGLASTPPGFKNAIDYEVKVSWGGNVDFLLMDGGHLTGQTDVSATRGDFVVDIHILPDPNQLIADTYADTLILTVEPTS